MADFDDVRRLALALPQAWEDTYKGEPWLQVGKRSFALISKGRVIFKLDRAHQDLLFEARPDVFQPCKVGTGGIWSYVDLDKVALDELADLVVEAWSQVVPKSVSGPFLEGSSKG